MEVMTKEKETAETTMTVEKETFKNHNAVDLLNVMDRIMATTGDLPVKVSYAIQRNVEKLATIVKKIQRESTEIVQTYVERDEAGKFKLTSLNEEDAKDPQKVATFRPQYIYSNPEQEVECQEKLKAYMEVPVKIDFYTIPLSYIQDVKIDTRQLGKSYGLFTNHIINGGF